MPQMFTERERESIADIYRSLDNNNRALVDSQIRLAYQVQNNSSPNWQPNTSLLAYEEAKRRASQPRDKTREEYGLDELADSIFGKQD